jgi:hypothetical protein
VTARPTANASEMARLLLRTREAGLELSEEEAQRLLAGAARIRGMTVAVRRLVAQETEPFVRSRQLPR